MVFNESRRDSVEYSRNSDLKSKPISLQKSWCTPEKLRSKNSDNSNSSSPSNFPSPTKLFFQATNSHKLNLPYNLEQQTASPKRANSPQKTESIPSAGLDSTEYDSDELVVKRRRNRAQPILDSDDDDDFFAENSKKPSPNSTASETSEQIAKILPTMSSTSELTKSFQKSIVLSSDDDHDDDFENFNQTKSDIISISSDEETDEETSVLNFFNQADVVDLQMMTGCDQEQSSTIVSVRPFEDYDDLLDKLKKKKKLNKRLIDAYLEYKVGYASADRIVKICGKYHEKLKSSMNFESIIQVDLKPTFYEEDIELKSYQKIGVEWMLRLWHNKLSGILADEMGLGKTAQVITFLSYLLELGKTGPHLIVVPTTTIDNWLRELERFGPKLQVLLYQGTQAERLDIQDSYPIDDFEFNVILTTEKQASANIQDRKYIKRLHLASLIIDEAHMLKSPKTARYQMLNSFTTRFRLLMTGTPLQNNFQELIALLSFIMPNLFQDHREDLEKICQFKFKAVTNSSDGEVSTEVLFNQKRIDRIKMMMDPFILRRNKEDVKLSLPSKTDKILHAPMPIIQKKMYRQVLERARNSKDQKVYRRIDNVLMELRKVANHPLLVRHHFTDSILESMSKKLVYHEEFPTNDTKKILKAISEQSDLHLHQLCLRTPRLASLCLSDSLFMNSAKAKLLSELLPKLVKQGDNILIFSQFTMMLDILEAILETLDIEYIRMDGETKAEERQPLIDEFNSNPSIKVFLLSTLAGGCGINLTAANVVILHDIGFNPQNDRQAECRAHRLGQKREVTVYRLISEYTLEEQMYKNGIQKIELDNKLKNSKGLDTFQEDKIQYQIFNDILAISSPEVEEINDQSN